MSLRHGYTSGDEVDRDNSHEYIGHGVSDAWIKKRVARGAKKASPERLGKFHGRMAANEYSANYAKASPTRMGKKFGVAVQAADRKMPSGGKGSRKAWDASDIARQRRYDERRRKK